MAAGQNDEGVTQNRELILVYTDLESRNKTHVCGPTDEKLFKPFLS